MAKLPRTPEEIEQVKEKILAAALDVITREGYANLSMRNIAKRTGMTAANLYNYFPSKDALYLTLLKRAFEKLYSALSSLTLSGKTPLEKLLNVGEAYINFAIKNKNYYEVMLMTSAPRYTDFVGTDAEKLASESKKTGLKVFNFILKLLREAFSGTPEQEARINLIRLWSTLHGIVSLYNYGILSELENQPLDTIMKIRIEAFNEFREKMESLSKKYSKEFKKDS